MKTSFSRALAVLLAAALLCGAAPLMAGAEGIDITDKFTDPAFRAAVQEIIGKDVILDTDVAGMTELDVSGVFIFDFFGPFGDISSLAGLEHFTALKYLNCELNQLTTLPALPSELDTLECSFNDLTSLPVLPSTLETLHCYSNKLTALPALPSSLEEISCDNNRLTALPALPSSLGFLSCSSNQLSELPALPSGLEVLVCFGNQLTVLPALPSSLTRLWCNMNQLTSLDLTGLQLKSLICDHNNMKNISALKGYTGSDGTLIFYPQNVPQDPAPFYSIWPSWAQWFLEYILFGWLWMAYV